QLFLEKELSHEAYGGNFSRLHAFAFALSDLPPTIKQPAAARMLEYPESLRGDPRLLFLIRRAADASPLATAEYWAAYPLGKLAQTTLELQDHWELVNAILERPELNPTVERRNQTLDWEMLLAHARARARAQADNNPFGIENQVWGKHWSELIEQHKGDLRSDIFVRQLKASRGWSDLRLLL